MEEKHTAACRRCAEAENCEKPLETRPSPMNSPLVLQRIASFSSFEVGSHFLPLRRRRARRRRLLWITAALHLLV
ncbi:hypothetical protein EYF80_048686 [Liparis tanakae]|uniref:Uncharacterized protein n=1 Tax=Liparis tanakae TaxID=230148 RepID=A0A4Z2FK43_9TELE|nr:hypothetical protein EYF80_048686 [Liparis tanakae]